jgi:hypothetical protein
VPIVDGMATNSEIRSRVTDAQDLALTPAEMVALCDRAVSELLTGKATSYSIAGRSFTFADVSKIQAIRDYYSNAPAVGGRGFISQSAEL